MDQVRTIRLYGKLGATFGRVHRFVVNNPKEAIRALIAMVPGFEKELMTSQDRGIGYAVFCGTRNISEKQLAYPSGSDDIRIAPILTGRKAGGLFQIIAGVALAVVGAVTEYFLPGNPFSTEMMMMGAALALGGIAQMVSRQQTTPTNLTSYNFSGAENTTSQGGPVPLLYGRMRVGSTVISEGLLAKDGTAQLVGGNLQITG
jgi:predicted phage tail protein